MCASTYFLKIFFIFSLSFICHFTYGSSDPVQTSPLLGSRDSVKVGYKSEVFDFELWRRSVDDKIIPLIDSSAEFLKLVNRVSVGIESESPFFIQSDFKVFVKLHIKKHDRSFLLNEEFDTTLVVNYLKAEGANYNSLNFIVFNDSYKTSVEILEIKTEDSVSWDVSRVLRVDNIMEVSREYVFSCQRPIEGLAVWEDASKGELEVWWSDPHAGQTEYDLEWAWIDDGSLSDFMNGSVIDAKKVFNNNASRVTISGQSYNIPLLYESSGKLYVRVRPVHQSVSGHRFEGMWVWRNNNIDVVFAYGGHETALNWQSSTTFAEEGKRKSVVQYFDGSLRSRQAVTKDNSSGTTIVSETFYDHQGRAVIEVLPAPTLATAISYSKNFNRAINHNGYPRELYDILTSSGDNCNSGSPALETISGASNYYSPANELLGGSSYNFNNYIPDALGYPFIESRFGLDGRVMAQGGAGATHRIGSGHEVQYKYEIVDQAVLDGLFGTDAGMASHYFKNIVRDANGQYSVSYQDMHGRTVATALAGEAPESLEALPNSSGNSSIRQLIDEETNRVIGRSIVSTKPLVVLKNGSYEFNYELQPYQLKLLNCDSEAVCYDCYYDLEITITAECNTAGFPYIISERNFSLNNFSTGAQCNASGLSNSGFTKTFSVMLPEGSYMISKVLTLSSEAQNSYRDKVYVKEDTCKSFSDFYNAEYTALTNSSDCNVTCADCNSALGSSFADFKVSFITNMGLSEPLSEQQENLIRSAYNSARENCDALCLASGTKSDGLEYARSVEKMMLNDMMPPNGQYANLSTPQSVYNIFRRGIIWLGNNGSTPSYKSPVNLEWGQPYIFSPSSSYKDGTGNSVFPDISTPANFTSVFQSSFARQLLYYHPEFKKLEAMMSQMPASYKFEEDLKNLNTWQDMIAATPSSPGGYITGILSHDPFFPYVIAGGEAVLGSEYRQQMQDKMDNYINMSSAPTSSCPLGSNMGYITMWQFAQSSVFCGTLSTSGCTSSPQMTCISDKGPFPPVVPSSGCAADWDMVWIAFRSAYLNERNKFISLYLNDVWNKDRPSSLQPLSNSNLVNYGFVPRIVDFTDINSSIPAVGEENAGLAPFFEDLTTFSNNPLNTASAMLQAQYNSTCAGYANMWIEKLEECPLIAQRWNDEQLKEQDSQWLLNRLIDICVKGSDINHPVGSSSIDPTGPNNTLYGFREFSEVIKHFITNICGFSINAECHPFLIDVPKAYQSQPALSNQSLITSPSECQCAGLNKLQDIFSNSGYGGTFSGFLSDNYATNISQGALDTLLSMCNKTFTCRFIKNPIQIPPLLQCTGAGGQLPNKVCINCNDYHLIVKGFKDDVGLGEPVNNPQSAEDTLINEAFQAYANNKTGFSKTWIAYLAFADECDNSVTINCTELDTILDMFYLSPQYLAHQSGDSCRQAFVTFFNTAFSVTYSYTKWMQVFLESCGYQPDPCRFRLSCSILKQLIYDFYALYGFGVYNHPDNKALLATYINGRTGLNLDFNDINNAYHSLCSTGCDLDLSSYMNCFVLTMIYDNFTTIHGGSPWTLPNCSEAFVYYFNSVLNNNPSWDYLMVKAAYASCRPGLSEQENCAPDIEHLCIPEISCSSLQYIVSLFHDRYNVDSLPNCIDTFVVFFNSTLHVNYDWNTIADYFKDHCGEEPNVCSPGLDCKKMLEFAYFFVPQNPDSCQTEFLSAFNITFGTSYINFSDVAWLYWSHCRHILSICSNTQLEPNCSNLQAVLADFRALYPDPATQLGDDCKTVFTMYYVLRLSPTSEPQFSQIMGFYEQCGIKLDVCEPFQAKREAFVNDFNNRFSVLTLPRDVKKQLFTILYNDKFINSVSPFHEKEPLVIKDGEAVKGSRSNDDENKVNTSVTFEQISNSLPQNMAASILSSPENLPVNRELLLSMKQAYYVMHPYGLPSNCNSDFVSWFNISMKTTYNFAALSSLYNQLCGQGSGYICGVPQEEELKALMEPTSSLTYQPPGPLLCGLNEPVLTTVPLAENPCSGLESIAFNIAEIKYNLYLDSIKNAFDNLYYSRCMSSGKLESFTVKATLSEYHYTLYYYDQAGNLVKTVPPAGVNKMTDPAFLNNVKNARLTNGSPVRPAHTLATEYRYNTLNSVVAQKTPDAGKSNFWYDRLGRLVLSMNAKQATENHYSYTLYDALGRMKEVGQLTNTTPLTDAISRNAEDKDIIGSLAWWMNNKPAEQITKTFYDISYSAICPEELCQRNLRNRVSYTAYYESGVPGYAPLHNTATFYSYDIHGNVDVLLQDYGNSEEHPNAMNTTGNRFKRIEYDYDLISGKVNEVSYQPGATDAFYHRYYYDAENRLTDVETSFDKVIWEKDARYTYYKHGPLARTVLGQNLVQGIDYAYTLQGWLKGINSTGVGDGSFDMGQDGKTGSVNKNIARDVFGISLNYFNGDYKPVGLNTVGFAIPFASITTGNDLFNGNIKSQLVSIPKLGDALTYVYGYDQLNRLTKMDAYSGINIATNVFTPVSTTNYKEVISYDANGNIQTYLRNNETGVAKNNYSYTYTPGTNRLAGITNSVNSQTKSYAYDEIGNTTNDGMQGMTNAFWNVYGKLQSATNKDGVNIIYTYSADGQRISKKVDNVEEWYVRDATGNVMIVYTKDAAINSGHISTKEYYKYGSSLLSIKNHTLDMQAPESEEVQAFVSGEDAYILTDHLGNTRAIVSDKKLQVENPSNAGHILYYLADVKTATYYSSFGATAKAYGQNPVVAFNGQHKSTEIGADAQTALFWEYDGDVGRRWNVDPKKKIYESPYLSFSGNPVVFNDYLGDSSGTEINGREYVLLNKNNVIGYYDRVSKLPNTNELNPLQQELLEVVNKMNSSGNKEIVDRLNTILGAKKYVNIKLGSSLDGLILETGVLNWSGIPNMFIMRNNGGEYTKPGKSVNQIVDADISFAHEFLGHAYQYVTGNLNHKRIDFIINGKRLGAPKAVEADAVNIANTYALFTLRASMISHVYIENNFMRLHGKEISLEEFKKLSEREKNEVEKLIFFHQIPSNFNLTNRETQHPSSWR